MKPITASHTESRWPHRLAVTLVCAVFPLIWVGGLVTTTDAGMAVKDWPSTYGYNLFLYPWSTWWSGPWDLFIEHGHRLLGALAGMITICLMVVVWDCDRRVWLRLLSLAALVMVILQGVLGGLRVLLDDRLLAMIHGCVAPAYFALCVSLAVFTSQRWKAPQVLQRSNAGSLHRFAFLTLALLYAQIVLGANVRHVPIDSTPGSFRVVVFFHLMMALLATIHVLFLASMVVFLGASQPALFRPGLFLAVLIFVQLGLGAATWVVKYGWPAEMIEAPFASGYTIQASGMLQTSVITGHVAVGSLLLGVSAQLALRAARFLRSGAKPIVKGAVA